MTSLNISALFTGIKDDRRQRVGRGIAGRGGKTAGRGTKGQNARTGAGRKIQQWFEGGQTPLYRILAKKRGAHQSAYTPADTGITITTDVLNRLYKDGETVSPETLLEKKIIRRSALGQPVKVVRRSELKPHLIFTNVKLSTSLAAVQSDK